jgi:hypothetical protein
MDYKITMRKFQGGQIVPLIRVPRMKHVAAAISDEKSFFRPVGTGSSPLFAGPNLGAYYIGCLAA